VKDFPGNYNRSLLWRLAVISLFAIAMGFLESAVVVYLRAIYYPGGFAFPLKMITGPIAITELLREAATMIMILAIAMLSDRRRTVRLAWFIYMFFGIASKHYQLSVKITAS
jgi:hypothetical protein